MAHGVAWYPLKSCFDLHRPLPHPLHSRVNSVDNDWFLSYAIDFDRVRSKPLCPIDIRRCKSEYDLGLRKIGYACCDSWFVWWANNFLFSLSFLKAVSDMFLTIKPSGTAFCTWRIVADVTNGATLSSIVLAVFWLIVYNWRLASRAGNGESSLPIIISICKSSNLEAKAETIIEVCHCYLLTNRTVIVLHWTQGL